MVRGISDSVDSRITNFKQRCKINGWYLRKWTKIVQLDDKEAVITQEELRIKMAVQRDADEPMSGGRTAWPMKTRSPRTILRCCVQK